MSFPSKSMQIMCITSSVAVMTSSVVVMTSSVAMVILGHGLNCDNKIAVKTMENPYYSNFKTGFFLMKEFVFYVKFYCIKNMLLVKVGKYHKFILLKAQKCRHNPKN